MSDEVSPLLREGQEHTVHSLVIEMASAVEDIEEIYTVVKMKDETWQVLECGTNIGLAFAIAILQRKLSEEI